MWLADGTTTASCVHIDLGSGFYNHDRDARQPYLRQRPTTTQTYHQIFVDLICYGNFNTPSRFLHRNHPRLEKHLKPDKYKSIVLSQPENLTRVSPGAGTARVSRGCANGQPPGELHTGRNCASGPPPHGHITRFL